MFSLKHITYFLFLFLLWASILQSKLLVFTEVPLKGVDMNAKDPTLSFDSWFNGNYATEKEEFIARNFAFRTDLVRLHNQLDYNLFDRINAKVIMGKEEYVYEQNYIDAYYGRDFIGNRDVNASIDLIKEVQDSLSVKNIYLLLLFAPGKGSYFPEFIPENYRGNRTLTNHDAFVEQCIEKKVNFIDLHSWFLAMKDTSKHKLYTRGGIHWSYYGDLLAFDSICRHLKIHTGKNIPSIKINSIKQTTNPQFRDNDASSALNLIYYPCRDTLSYPTYSVVDSGGTKPSLLNIGDSYFFGIYLYKLWQNIFSDVSFWYYYKEYYKPGRDVLHNNDFSFMDTVLSKDIITVMYTDGTLNGLGSGFFQDAQKNLRKPN